MKDRLDFAEATMIEPALHGAWTTIDEALDKLAEKIAELNKQVDSPAAVKANVRAEEAAGGAAGWLTPEQRADRDRRKEELRLRREAKQRQDGG